MKANFDPRPSFITAAALVRLPRLRRLCAAHGRQLPWNLGFERVARLVPALGSRRRVAVDDEEYFTASARYDLPFEALEEVTAPYAYGELLKEVPVLELVQVTVRSGKKARIITVLVPAHDKEKRLELLKSWLSGPTDHPFWEAFHGEDRSTIAWWAMNLQIVWTFHCDIAEQLLGELQETAKTLLPK